MAEPVEMLFYSEVGGGDSLEPMKPCRYKRHLANTIELSVLSGYADCRYHYTVYFFLAGRRQRGSDEGIEWDVGYGRSCHVEVTAYNNSV